jgi:hypothetical protein
MRIISDFHDYYDGALALGQDASIVFKRKTTLVHAVLPNMPWEETRARSRDSAEITVTRASPHFKFPSPWRPGYTSTQEDVILYRSLLLLGGEAREVWCSADGRVGGPTAEGAVRAVVRSWPTRRSDETRTIQSNTGPVLGLVSQECLDELDLKPRRTTKITKDESADRRGLDLRFQASLKKDWTDTHLALNAPLLLLVGCPRPSYIISAQGRTGPAASQRSDGAPWTLVDNKEAENAAVWSARAGITVYAQRTPGVTTEIIRNPALAPLNLAASLDPFACFQTLAQFIGGVVPGRSMPMVVLSDQDLVQKKGFDPIYGFRTRPKS